MFTILGVGTYEVLAVTNQGRDFYHSSFFKNWEKKTIKSAQVFEVYHFYSIKDTRSVKMLSKFLYETASVIIFKIQEDRT